MWSYNMTRQYRLPDHVSVFSAELYAILKALDMAIQSHHDKIVIFSDSLSALQAIRSGRTDTNEIQGKIVNKLYNFPKRLMLIWVPGHCGIQGNERADRLARMASALGEITPLPRGLKSCMERGRATLLRQWQREWDGLGLTNKIKHTVEYWQSSYRTIRREEVALARLRLNSTRPTHMDAFINKSFPPQCHTCQRHLTINHILLSCGRYVQERRRLQNLAQQQHINFSVYDLLQDNEEVVKGVLSFLRSIQIINHI